MMDNKNPFRDELEQYLMSDRGTAKIIEEQKLSNCLD